MNLLKSRPRNRFTPRVEALEDRQLLATVLLSGTTLTINGTNKSDKISVFDNGTDTAGAIIVQDQGVTIFTSTTAITTIIINSNDPSIPGSDKGTDDVSYTLSGSLLGTIRVVRANFADGKNNFTANINGTAGPGFGLLLIANGLTGKKDNFQVNVNATTLPGDLQFGLYGGPGDDTLNVNVVNGLVMSANSELEVTEKGGGGKDKINYTFSGQMNGTGANEARMFIDLEGGPDNDDVSALVNLNSPGGRLVGENSPLAPQGAPFFGGAAQVKGDDGNDKLSFVVNGQPDATTSFALVDGGPGKDKCHKAGAVNLSVNCESTF
jgi:hypothetical protein